MHRFRTAAALFAALSLAACGGATTNIETLSSSPTPTSSSAPSYATTYIAIGDDATVGIGTSACGTTLPSTLCPSNFSSTTGTQRTIGGGTSVNGYSQLFATHLQSLHAASSFTFIPLGVSGALTGGAPQPGGSPNAIVLNTDQLSTLPGAVAAARGLGYRVVITLFAGMNDVVDAFAAQQCTAGGGSLTGNGLTSATATDYCDSHGTTVADGSGNQRKGSLYTGYSSIVTAIKVAAPDAILIVGVPDVSTFPAFAASGLGAAKLQQLSADSQSADTALQDALADGTVSPPYVHLFGTSVLSSADFAGDGFHFNDAGGAAIEGAMATAFSAAYPSF